jgi:hypothetical protein
MSCIQPRKVKILPERSNNILASKHNPGSFLGLLSFSWSEHVTSAPVSSSESCDLSNMKVMFVFDVSPAYFGYRVFSSKSKSNFVPRKWKLRLMDQTSHLPNLLPLSAQITILNIGVQVRSFMSLSQNFCFSSVLYGKVILRCICINFRVRESLSPSVQKASARFHGCRPLTLYCSIRRRSFIRFSSRC